MKPGRGRSRTAVVLRIDGVVALRVLKLVVDVGRQRHLPEGSQYFFKNPLVMKMHPPVPIRQHIHDFGSQRISSRLIRLPETHKCTGPAFLSRPHEGLPLMLRNPAQQQDLHRTAGSFSLSEQPCGDDFGVIDHKHVSPAKITADVPEHIMLHGAILPAKDKQPGR